MEQSEQPTVGFDEVMKLVQFRKETSGYANKEGKFQFPFVESSEVDAGLKVLVLAPHQDDEVLGCGGSICLYARQRAEVKVLYLTDGSLGGLDDTGSELALHRRTEAKEGLFELSCYDATFLNHPDMTLKCEPETVNEVLKVLEEFRPDKIFVPFFFELHPDHMAAGKIIAHAMQWYPYDVDIYNYEVWTPLSPNVLIDISETIDAKSKALAKHVSQLKMINYIDKIRGLNAYRSITAGRNALYCEAFIKCSRTEHLKMAKLLGVLS